MTNELKPGGALTPEERVDAYARTLAEIAAASGYGGYRGPLEAEKESPAPVVVGGPSNPEPGQ